MAWWRFEIEFNCEIYRPDWFCSFRAIFLFCVASGVCLQAVVIMGFRTEHFSGTNRGHSAECPYRLCVYFLTINHL